MFFTKKDRMINYQDSLVNDQKKTILFIQQLEYNVPLSYSAAGQLTPDGQIIEIFIEMMLILQITPCI